MSATRQRAFSDHLAHLERMSRELRVGVRVVVPQSGRTGTIVRGYKRHSGYLVRSDEPVYGKVEGRVCAANLDTVQA